MLQRVYLNPPLVRSTQCMLSASRLCMNMNSMQVRRGGEVCFRNSDGTPEKESIDAESCD